MKPSISCYRPSSCATSSIEEVSSRMLRPVDHWLWKLIIKETEIEKKVHSNNSTFSKQPAGETVSAMKLKKKIAEVDQSSNAAKVDT